VREIDYTRDRFIFRVWDREHKNMSRPFVFPRDDMVIFPDSLLRVRYLQEPRYVYLQFIGLFDITGAPIFEHDILKYELPGKGMKIVVVEYVPHLGGYTPFVLGRPDEYVHARYLVLLGNVYENNNLLMKCRFTVE
jgi:hypothetical protein